MVHIKGAYPVNQNMSLFFKVLKLPEGLRLGSVKE